jgi:DNA polymerase I
MQKLFLLDVSGYLYRAYFALPRLTDSQGRSTHALYGFIRSVLRLMKDFQPTHLAAVFDGPDNKRSRTEIYAEYKIHRQPTPEDLPQQIVWADKFCQLAGIPRLTLPGVEADDAMGSITQWAAQTGAHVYLCTSDKDLAQLVTNQVTMVNPLKDDLLIDPKKVEELYGVRPDQIIDLLALMGDASDNIPGLPGIGPKTAVSLLQQFGTLDEILAHPEQVVGQKKQETIREKADLARISRELATIDVNLDCPKEEAFYIRQKPNREGLLHFYQEHNFSTLVKELEREVPAQIEEKVDYRIVDDPKEVEELIDRLSKESEICFDTEGTSASPMRAELVGIAFSTQKGSGWYLPANGNVGQERLLKQLLPLLTNPKIRFYGHDVKNDLHLLANHGIKVANLSFDTVLASYLLSSHDRRRSLDQLVAHYFSKAKTDLKNLIGTGKKQITFAELSIDQAGTYCCENVDYTLRLKEILSTELEQRGLTSLLKELELPLLSILLKMERYGIYVDPTKLSEMSLVITKEIGHLQEEIYQLAGEPFAINSPKQLSAILYEKMGIRPPRKTATGFSTDADALEALALDHPIAGKVLEYRGLEKLRSTYVDSLPNEILERDGRVHCTFNQTIAATGRLSCQSPNLQNIPVRTEVGRQIRVAFHPEQKDWSFLSADYSQIELRLMAHFSEDPSLLKAFEEGEDVHASTAARVFGIPLDQVTKEQRHLAKAVNFGILYGQQAFGLARELKVSVKVAATFIEKYFERYPKVKYFLEQSIQRARDEGRATTMIGRERLIPDLTSRNGSLRNAAERLAINTPLQGSAADIIKLAMIEVDRRLSQSGLSARMLLQIHDELFFELPDHEIDQLSALVKEAMEGVMKLKVPLVVDVAVGKNWREC